MDALGIPSIPRKKKRYVTLIFGDGGSMHTVLFPLTPAIALTGRQTRIIGPEWSIVAAAGSAAVVGYDPAVTVV